MKAELKEAMNVFFSEWGFSGPKDYFTTVLGIKGAVATISIQALLGVGFAVLSFVENWIWNPPIAYFLLVLVILLDAWYGYRVAVKRKGEKFSWRKGYRTFSILGAHTLQLFFFYNLGTKVYPAAIFIAHGVFIYLTAYKVKSWLTHLALLQLQEGGLIRFILKLITSRYGQDFVDVIQHNYDKRTDNPAGITNDYTPDPLPGASAGIDNGQPKPDASEIQP